MKIDPKFEAKLCANPSARVAVIATTDGAPSQVAPRAEALGLQVHRQFRLRQMLALQGPADAVLALLDEPSVLSVEEDRPVTTMDG